MKKIILAAAILSIGLPSVAQKSKKVKSENTKPSEIQVAPQVESADKAVKAEENLYQTTMKGLILKMNGANSTDAYDAVANGFERIAEAESSEWLPKYYAAYCKLMSVFSSEDKTAADAKIEEAEKLISLAETTPNSELLCLKGMCHQARIGVDPMARGRQYSELANELLSNSLEIDPLNPRPDFLRGQSAFYTPEAFGGGKKVAKKYFQSALEKYTKSKPENELMPNWGFEATKAMLAQCDK